LKGKKNGGTGLFARERKEEEFFSNIGRKLPLPRFANAGREILRKKGKELTSLEQRKGERGIPQPITKG